MRFLNDVTDELVKAGVLAEIADRQGTFTLLRAPDSLGVREIFDLVSRAGVPASELGLAQVEPRIADAMARAAGGLGQAVDGVTVGALIG